MAFLKGKKWKGSRSGRKKGSLNKTTATAKQVMQGVIDGLGVQWFIESCKIQPSLAVAILLKLAPTQPRSEPEGFSNPVRIIFGNDEDNLNNNKKEN